MNPTGILSNLSIESKEILRGSMKDYFTVNELPNHFFFLTLLPAFGSILKKTPARKPYINLSLLMICPWGLPQLGHFSVFFWTNDITLWQLKHSKAAISLSSWHYIIRFIQGRLWRAFFEVKTMKDDYFTVNELAEHFRVNPKTIYRRLWTKGIPAYKVGQQWRIAKKDLIWLKR